MDLWGNTVEAVVVRQSHSSNISVTAAYLEKAQMGQAANMVQTYR